MIENIAGLIAFTLFAFFWDWLLYTRCEAFYAHKEAAYHPGFGRAGLILIFSAYTWWALVSRGLSDRLPPYFLVPSLLLLCVWMTMTGLDLKRRLVDIDDMA